MKGSLLRTLMLPGIPSALTGFLRDRATVLMLHRMAVPDLGVRGHDPDQLRRTLEWLRKRHFELLPLRELLERLRGNGPRVRGAVSFTLDDGYFDQVEVAAPIFAEFDCSATTFVCSGFADRELWMWWDRIAYVFSETQHEELAIAIGKEQWKQRWDSARGGIVSRLDFIERCKGVSERDKLRAIEQLAQVAEVEVPEIAPPRFAPLTWETLRWGEQLGMRFAPHTRTHPVLSRTPDAQARHEIEHSTSRLRAEARHPDPIFCYPNGQHGDFGPRELAVLEDLGFEAAVVGAPGYATSGAMDDRFRIPRFSYDDRVETVAQYVTGFEHLKQWVRGAP